MKWIKYKMCKLLEGQDEGRTQFPILFLTKPFVHIHPGLHVGIQD